MRAIAALSLLFAVGARADEWTRSYSVGTNPELSVSVDDADVAVRPGPSGRIDARITSAGYEFRPGEVEIRDTQAGSRVEIEVKQPRASRPFSAAANRWIRVELTVPASIAAAGIQTGDGNVEVGGLSGALRFETGDGNITGDSLGGTLDAKTGDGNVRVAGKFTEVSARTGDGNIEVRAASGSQIANSWRFITGDGNVRLFLPSDVRSTLEIRTGDGRIHSDLTLSGVPTTDRKRDDSELRGDLNGGGAMISVRTGDGDVFLNSLR
jgi:hypothetical protein